jgi:hypothetical protein
MSESQLATAEITPGFHKATSALATTLGIEPRMMVETLKKQCFPNQNSDNISDAQLASFISVAITLKLNPLVPGMLYAYPGKNGAMIPVTGPDGVFKMLDERIAGGNIVGYECVVFPEDPAQKPTHAMATIWRAGSEHPSKYTAAFSEWVVGSNPNWASRPRHMLWLRALKQCARQVIHGIPYDEDEVVIGDLKDVTPVPPRAPAPPRTPKGVSVVKENAPKSATEVPGELVEEPKSMASAPKPPSEPPTPPPQGMQETPKPTPKPKPKSTPIVQRTSLQDKETVTVVVSVSEFSTREITKAGVPHPSVSASISGPELKGDVFHLGGAKVVAGEGGAKEMQPDAAWQLDKPVRLTIRGEFSPKLNRVVSWVEKIEVQEASPATPAKADDV